MAAIDTTRSAYGSSFALSRIPARIFSFLAGLHGAVEAWQDARMTRKVLSDLTDHELADIGLLRSEIETLTQDDPLR